MSRYDEDSLDDLDTTLDKALNTASNSLFNSSRHSSQGSAGAIPLTSFGNTSNNKAAGSMNNNGYSDASGSGGFSGEDHDDSSPLIDNRFNNSTSNRSFDSTSSLSPSSHHKEFAIKRWFNQLVKFFKLAKFELNQERNKFNSEQDERFISPRNNKVKNQYPTNSISNAKYNPITFIPIILYEQFKFFFNLYFLLVALSQIVPQLRIGYLSSYIVPLAFVLCVTMLKEATDDISRRRRDIEQNNESYEVLNRNGPNNLTPEPKFIASKNLRVGDLIKIHKGTRIPADIILVQSSDKEGNGEAFIKTDQLDGETDWKLRVANAVTQQMTDISDLINNISLIVGNPSKSIHNFSGKLVYHPNGYGNANSETIPLTIDQTMWANTVLATGSAIGIVIYTGIETRQLLNTTKTGVKTGLLELEINRLAKILCVSVFLLSAGLIFGQGWPLKKTWYIDILRYLILFSSIIPVSLRVNLDLAKSVYASQIHRDKEIRNTIVRTSTIPEDLGRIEYLLSDKTGTLTQNDMELKKIHLGSVSYAGDTLDMVSEYINNNISKIHTNNNHHNLVSSNNMKKRDLSNKVYELVLTLALCHNVTPTYDEEEDEDAVTYQAASPDEIAIVKFTELVGLKLIQRDRKLMTLLHLKLNQEFKFDILYVFPFSSDTKRMGIIVKDVTKDEIHFLQKGADAVMINIVSHNDWLEEETSNMAREGLRTLVIGKKKLNQKHLQDFENTYREASLSMYDRDLAIQKVINHYLEQDLELLGLTGVEDKLQKNVKSSIELLRNAGIKIWMLTGDKVETAKCVSISCKLITRGQYIHQITKVNHPDLALNHLETLKMNLNSALLIDGESLSTYMKFHKHEFFAVVLQLPTVIACRCSPQQKADIAKIIKELTGKRTCCIGDGGNDVSMIQCADVGVGIVGKEGKQASLAADFSIDQFYYLCKLLLWHGRNSYKRSSKLGQFIMHRGLIISVCQAVYSISSNFEPLALYQGFLMVGYATIYTMMPVFSLTLDCDVNENLTKIYPELYRELTLGRSLSYKSFFMWCFISLYQGNIIQLLSQKFQTLDDEVFKQMVSLSFSALVFNELIMVCLQINQWNKVMIITLITTFLLYVGSIPFLTEYFDLDYVSSFLFIWQCLFILLLSLFPIWLFQTINRKLRPPSYAKVQQD